MVSSRIFRSRWYALFWSAGILWTAYDVVSSLPSHAADNSAAAANSSQGTDATGEGYTDADLQALASAMNTN